MATAFDPRSPSARGGAIDLTWHVGGTAAAVGLCLFVMASIPQDAKSLSLDTYALRNRYISSHQLAVQEEEATPEWLKAKAREAGTPGKAHSGPSGKMGSHKSKNKDGLVGLKGPKDNPDPHMARTLATEAARQAGVLGIFRQAQSSHIASIFGRESPLGRDAENALGGLIGTQIQEAYGVPGGLGLVGTQRGGGGTGDGTYGPGGLGTIGKCAGRGCGPGYGPGYWRRGPQLDGVRRLGTGPEVIGGTVKTRGRLDKEIIRRVIRGHLKEVKFCYERELVRKPDLYGRITVQFTITPTGSVVASAVAQSTLGDRGVEQCITRAVARWTFPQPQDGGVVLVNYPFVLQSSAGK
jgi:TonB family protein